jgi:hypothetical protein
VSALLPNKCSPLVYYDDEEGKKRRGLGGGLQLESPLADNQQALNFYKQNSSLGIMHNLSHEGSLSPSASATPQLSIQQDS